MKQLMRLSMALGLALVFATTAFAGETTGRGTTKGTGTVSGKTGVRGTGTTSGKGVVVYRDKNGKVQYTKGTGTVTGKGMAIGKGSATGTGKAAGKGDAMGTGTTTKRPMAPKDDAMTTPPPTTNPPHSLRWLGRSQPPSIFENFIPGRT